MPDVPGGGTVAYVNTDEHRYLEDPSVREEGGTPAIIEAVRAGLVFQLKQAVGAEVIRASEARLLRRAVRSWLEEPALELLGNLEAERLSIVSFVVRSPSGRYLHHNYVVALLNDLFGVQARGGCSCAGPYGHRLLGIDIDRSHEFEREITGGCEGIKPGWVRVNFNYFLSDTVADYLVDAVRMVARDGWRLLGDYRFDTQSGRWRHCDGLVEPPISLRAISYDGGVVSMPSERMTGGEDLLAQQLCDAAEILAAATGPDLQEHPGPRERGLRAPAVVRPPSGVSRRLTPYEVLGITSWQPPRSAYRRVAATYDVRVGRARKSITSAHQGRPSGRAGKSERHEHADLPVGGTSGGSCPIRSGPASAA